LDYPAPVQNSRIEFSVRSWIAGIWINSKSSGRAPARDRITNLSSNGDRPNPGQCIRKIAEAFADIQGRGVDIERLRTNALRARPTPFDAETDRHDELMGRVLEQAIFEGRLQILKSVRAESGRPAGGAEMAVRHAERDCECFGDPLGKLA